MNMYMTLSIDVEITNFIDCMTGWCAVIVFYYIKYKTIADMQFQ